MEDQSVVEAGWLRTKTGFCVCCGIRSGMVAVVAVLSRAGLPGLIGWGLVSTACGLEIRFSRAEYTVVAGGVLEVQVEMALDPGDELFSYGVRLVTGAGGGVEATEVEVPPELRFTGLAAGATKDPDPAVLGVKGNTEFGGGRFQPYTGALLATYTLKGNAPGTVGLGLELYRTAGPNEDVFVTPEGIPLDDTITFGTAALTVVAPPPLEMTRLDAGRVRVRYEMVSGLRYFLRRSEDLVEWELVSETVKAAVRTASFEFSTGASGKAFFRLEAIPDGA